MYSAALLSSGADHRINQPILKSKFSPTIKKKIIYNFDYKMVDSVISS